MSRNKKSANKMSTNKFVLIFLVIIALSSAILAQDQSQDNEKVIRRVPIRATSPVSGKDMYNAYCAVCHGTDGKGGGPAASALKVAPTDLTMLSQNNGGKYPALKVSASIQGKGNLPAHGSEEMPVWGSLFWSISSGHESEVQQRVANLTKYVESLQVK